MKMREKIVAYMIRGGLISIGASLCLFGVIYFPVVFEEVRYRFNDHSSVESQEVRIVSAESMNDTVDAQELDEYSAETVVAASDAFGVIVPKIGANAPVVADVDPFEESVYRAALHDGIAHAAGSSYPSEEGNVFLFAHSSDNFYNAGRYNTVFYLLNKLVPGDDVMITYEGKIYAYEVFDVRVVSDDAVSYLNSATTEQVLTLMTCWPPGTNMNRLLVEARLVSTTNLSEDEN